MKQFTSISVYSVIFMICLAIPSSILYVSVEGNSGTTVGGIIWSDTTWTLEGSPYTITETVQIPSGVTLTIEPGVTINKPTAGDMFLLHGIIYAHGTPENKIVFDGGYNSNFFGNEGTWNIEGIFLDLDYCEIKNGLSFWPAHGNRLGSFRLTHTNLTNLTDWSYIWYSEKDITIEYNKFINTAGFVFGIRDQVQVNIQYNIFKNANQNSDYCIRTTRGTAIVKYNSFVDMEGFVLGVAKTSGMSAANNYWGTTNTAIIDSMIYDRNDEITCDNYIEYLPILSEPHPDTPKISTSISCLVSQSELTIGDSVTISGLISPDISGASVTLSVKRDEDSWNELTTLTTNSAYSYSWTPEAVGLYEIKASWDGIGVYEGATSDVIPVQVNKISTIISCSVSPSNLIIGDPLTISGSISPPIPDVIVTLTYTKPDDSTFTRTVTTDSDGSYTDTYEPDIEGIWSVNASWEGDESHTGCISPLVSFTLDGTPPTISITSPSIGSVIKSSSVTITWSGTDVLSGIGHYEVKLDETSWVDVGIDSSYILTGVNDGSHIISIRAVDMAGNSKVEQVSFIVNTSLIGGPGWIDDIAVIGGIGIIAIVSLLLILRRTMSMKEWWSG